MCRKQFGIVFLRGILRNEEKNIHIKRTGNGCSRLPGSEERVEGRFLLPNGCFTGANLVPLHRGIVSQCTI